MQDDENYLSKGYRNEVLKVILLSHLCRKEGYPYELLKAIQEKKIWFLRGVVKSDLYNALNSLEKHGYIRSKVVLKGAVARKNYTLTPEGKKIVREMKIAMLKSFGGIIKMIKE